MAPRVNARTVAYICGLTRQADGLDPTIAHDIRVAAHRGIDRASADRIITALRAFPSRT
jgi:hypothetical protein